MEMITMPTEYSSVLLTEPNDALYVGPCRMSLGQTKRVGVQTDIGSCAPGLPSRPPSVDYSQSYLLQEVIFEDLMNPGNVMIFPGSRQGTYDACGRDVIVITYFRQQKNWLGKVIDNSWNSWLVAVIGMNNGHVVSNHQYPFWRKRVSRDQKVFLAQIVSSCYDHRPDWVPYFNGSLPIQSRPTSEYA